MYCVKVNGEVVKKYLFKKQAVVYCFLKGYVNKGRRYYFLDDRVKIEEFKR